MPSDIRESLTRAAGIPTGSLDLAAARRRGRRIRFRRTLLATMSATLLVAVTTLGVNAWIEQSEEDDGRLPTATALHVRSVIKLPGAPTEVVAHGGLIWVGHSDDEGGFVLSGIDPSSDEVVQSMPLRGFLADLTSLGDDLWVAIGGPEPTVVNYRDEVLQREVALPFNPTKIAGGSGLLWVAGPEGVLANVDTETGQVHEAASIQPGLLAVGPDSVVAVDEDHRLVSVNEAVDLSEPVALDENAIRMEMSEGRLWVYSQLPDGEAQLEIFRLNESRDSTVVPLDLGPGAFALAAGGGWVVTDGDPEDGVSGRIVHVDSSGRILETIPVGQGPVGIAASDGALWVTDFDDPSVIRIELP